MRMLAFLACLMAAVLFAGCGTAGNPVPPADDEALRSAIGHTTEYQAEPDRFAECFVEGSVPDDATRNRLRGLMARLDSATVSGDGASASAQVLFEVLQTGEQLGPFEWTLTRAGDQWKVKTLELPPASSANAN